MKVSIMQPNIFMWGGLLKSIIDSDIHVVLDIVNSSKNSTYNRNRIAGNGDPTWLTIPFIEFKRSKKIMHQQLDTSRKSNTKIINLYQNRYSQSNYFKNGLNVLGSTIFTKEPQTNLILIYENFLNALKSIGLPICEIKYASKIIDNEKIDHFPSGVDLVNYFLTKFDAEKYLASENTIKYCSPCEYKVKEVCIQNFRSSKYPQSNNNSYEFLPNLSCIDLISHLNIEEIIDNLNLSNTWNKFSNLKN